MTWRWFIAKRLPSLNDRLQNAGASRWKYAAERGEWALWFRTAKLKHAIPKATKPRKLVVTRVYCGREQERDYVNLVGGCKAVVDALVNEGLLVDDKPKWLADEYRQVRGTDGDRSGTWFELEDLTDA